MYPPGAMLAAMKKHSGKRISKVRLTLIKRAFEVLDSAGKLWTAWEDNFTSFGVNVQPSGTNTKSLLCDLSSEYAA